MEYPNLQAIQRALKNMDAEPIDVNFYEDAVKHFYEEVLQGIRNIETEMQTNITPDRTNYLILYNLHCNSVLADLHVRLEEIEMNKL